MRQTSARSHQRVASGLALCLAATVAVSPLTHAAEQSTPSATLPSPAAPKAAAPAPAAPIAAEQNQQTKSDASEAGALLFNNACRTCHAVDVGDHRLGPSLAAIVGRKAGQQSGYTYSEALKNSKLIWDEKNLDAFIANPDALVPGNNMKPYTGMTNATDRANIVTYLRSGATKKTE